MHRTLALATVASMSLLIACGGFEGSDNGGTGSNGTHDVVLDKNDIAISLNSLNDSDFEEVGLLDKDENIGQGSSDPWGDFIAEVESVCGGDRASFEPTEATIRIDVAGSTNIDDFEDLVSGKLRLRFLDTTGNDASSVSVVVAEVTQPVGEGPVDMTVVADAQEMAVLYEPLVGGDFHVGVQVETALDSGDDFSVNLVMSLGMGADCE